MLIALTFAHFSSRANCCWKSKWLSLLKKTFTNAGHIDAKLIDFSEICRKKHSEIGFFLLIVSWRSFPPKFPVKSADFPKNLPLKILRKLTFFRQKSRSWTDFSANFDFSPAKIAQNRPIVLWILTFFPRKSPADFSANLSLKTPRNFAFFSAKYQKPWTVWPPHLPSASKC